MEVHMNNVDNVLNVLFSLESSPSARCLVESIANPQVNNFEEFYEESSHINDDATRKCIEAMTPAQLSSLTSSLRDIFNERADDMDADELQDLAQLIDAIDTP
jgi:uncharacterized protein YcbK (DUF882 family)